MGDTNKNNELLEENHLQHIGEIEKRLWSVADHLRANSNFSSNEYFMPVMGLIFLRHAYSRFLRVKSEIEGTLPTRGGKTRPLTKEDFSQRGSIFLKPEAQFDHLVGISDSGDRAKAIINAMESIEADYETLIGALPKAEYQELDNDDLGQLLRTFNDPALQKADGDIFGRIYEYFLTQFADLKAHDGGEFFTPISIVETIVNVIEPDHGDIIDPACGSGGMFVQSAHFIEKMKANPNERVTFYGMEKNPTTIRLAKMNLAVHGLEGHIQKAISYYEDPHALVGKADFVMANPPFNVDEIDAEKIKNDPRLPFGLPGVNKEKKVSNGNYVWMSFFHSYLKDKGRAGFVMSSQASSAGGKEAEVRKAMIETGDVDAMIAIRGNFFYTRSIPCELWFLDKGKPNHLRDKVLMIDARNIYNKVTRKIFDFTPEQEKNITSIVWLYRGQNDRFLALVEEYLDTAHTGAVEIKPQLDDLKANLKASMAHLTDAVSGSDEADDKEQLDELKPLVETLTADLAAFEATAVDLAKSWDGSARDNAGLNAARAAFEPLGDTCRDLSKQIDHVFKLSSRLNDVVAPKTASGRARGGEGKKLTDALDAARQSATDGLKQVRYFHHQAEWLQSRFPKAELADVEGLVKLVDHTELEANDWSLTPGRYVGVAPEEEDEDFDFEAALRDIHIEIVGLNAEAVELVATIKKNFEELGV
ncbi:MAG: DNA methyltransferase [Nioella sp.]|nr:DNA methyltransferase [Nioella sp.]